MTLREIYENVAHRCDKNPDTPDPLTYRRILLSINDRYREIMRTPGIAGLRDESFSFTTTANRARYPIPFAASSIVSITDTTHRVLLTQRPQAWIRQRDPAVPPSATGTPYVYAVLNYSGVAQQPTVTTPSALEILSASASDTADVEVEYQDADGAFRVALVTLNGTTPVTVAVTAAQVFRLTYLGIAQATITLRQISDGAIIAQLPGSTLVSPTSNLHGSRGWVLQLWPTPAGAYPYTVDGSRQREALVELVDEPAFPEDYHTLLVWGACLDELVHMDDDRAEQYEQWWQRDLRAFRASVHQIRGQRMIPDSGTRVDWTPMGSNYPAWQ